MEPDMNSTRPYETGEMGTTSREPSFLSIGAKSIWADGRDQTFIGTTSGTGDLESRVADICTRLPPPPIPPWLESSPDRLRHLVSNYSCWERYAELCSVNIPYMKSSSRTQMGELHSNDEMGYATMSRLLPFLAAITVGLLMMGVIAGAYFWHQRKRQKFSFSAKYMKQPSPTRDYCSPNFYMTPSVTVETQLSLCALVDDNFRIQPFSIYKEEAWPYNVVDTSSTSTKTKSKSMEDSSVYETLSSPSFRKTNEILLQPDQLEDDDDEPFYPSTQTFCSDPINSTHSIPAESGRQIKTKDFTNQRHTKRRDKQKHQIHPCQTPMLLETNSNSPYVQIQSLHDFPDSSNDECQSQLQLNQSEHPQKRRGVVVGAMRKCKDAGNKVIARLPWKNGISRSTGKNVSSSSSSTSNRRLDRPIRALRQSLKGLRGSIGHRRLQNTPPQKTTDRHNVMVVPSSDDDAC